MPVYGEDDGVVTAYPDQFEDAHPGACGVELPPRSWMPIRPWWPSQLRGPRRRVFAGADVGPAAAPTAMATAPVEHPSTIRFRTLRERRVTLTDPSFVAGVAMARRVARPWMMTAVSVGARILSLLPRAAFQRCFTP
jgi:hypothetical protein